MGQIGRRQFLIAATASCAAQFARAQQPGRIYRVGALFIGRAEAMQLYRSALSKRLSTHGFVEGRNLQIEHRVGQFVGSESNRNAVTALLAFKPDALFTCLTSPTQAAQSLTSTVPIVFTWVTDPVGSGLVQSYARPGGNVTGVTNRFAELFVKRLEFARELLPGLKRVAVTGAFGRRYLELVPPFHSAAKQFGIDLIEVDERSPEAGVAFAARGGAEVIIPFAVFAYGYRSFGERTVRAALESRIPAIFASAGMVEAGGLMSIGTNSVDDVRRGADLLARVLKGAKPVDLPVDQAARFELAVNLKTAKALGLTIPPSIMLRADRVIE